MKIQRPAVMRQLGTHRKRCTKGGMVAGRVLSRYRFRQENIAGVRAVSFPEIVIFEAVFQLFQQCLHVQSFFLRLGSASALSKIIRGRFSCTWPLRHAGILANICISYIHLKSATGTLHAHRSHILHLQRPSSIQFKAHNSQARCRNNVPH